MIEKLNKYILDNYENPILSFSDFELEKEIKIEPIKKMKASFENAIGSSNINTFIENNNIESNFADTLFNMIDEKGLIDSEVYNKVHIDRRLFSKIRNEKNYHPSKETVLLLGLALELNEEEIEKLLDSAAYSLPKNNYYDLIMRFCFKEGIYKITEVNELLESYDQRLFNY